MNVTDTPTDSTDHPTDTQGRARDPDTGHVLPKDPGPVLDLFAARDDQCEPLTASEVADQLDWARRTALKKLNDLVDDGDLAAKKVGGRAKVYWTPDER